MLNNTDFWRARFGEGSLKEQLSVLYQEKFEQGYSRYITALNEFDKHFGKSDRKAGLFSAPGRTELAGNHTDHQHGRVLAAAVTIDIIAVASPREDFTVTIYSKGFGLSTLEISDTSFKPDETGTSHALIRGMADAISKRGQRVKGFDAYITSDIPHGAGLSSSAAFEVLIAEIFNQMYCGGTIDPVDMARYGQYAENSYFGKPCGLMDQTASAVGGIVAIDFQQMASPAVQKLDFAFADAGYCLCVTNAGGSHADLTDEYASITQEMRLAAAAFGKEVLRDVGFSDFMSAVPELRKSLPDRAILRAMHYFLEDQRVCDQTEAIKAQDIERYQALMQDSGRSSMTMLQNIWPAGDSRERSVALALALSETLLSGCGAWRVHGGGFAGTIQALVPKDRVPVYKARMDDVFGYDACQVLSVRPVGAYTFK